MKCMINQHILRIICAANAVSGLCLSVFHTWASHCHWTAKNTNMSHKHASDMAERIKCVLLSFPMSSQQHILRIYY